MAIVRFFAFLAVFPVPVVFALCMLGALCGMVPAHVGAAVLAWAVETPQWCAGAAIGMVVLILADR